MFNYDWRFTAGGVSYHVAARYGMSETRLTVSAGGAVLSERVLASTAPEALDPQALTVETAAGPLVVTIGYVSWWRAGCEARLGEEVVFRSSRKPWARFTRMRRMMEEAGGTPEERAAAQERAKARMPSVYVDIGLAVVFFLVARQTPDWQAYGLTFTGLQTAALVGAGATLALFVVQRFVKVDLLGGFAVFGVVMSLISAGAALAFQSDLAVKLRGAAIGTIAAAAFLADGAAGGRVLGVRLVGYLETFLRLKPARAAIAMGLAGLAVAVIDVAAAFALTGDLWLVYNAALDGFIALPLVFGALWLARERPAAK